MSRIGKLKIEILKNVECLINSHSVSIKGPKGSISKFFDESVFITEEKGYLLVSPKSDTKHSISMYGTVRSILNNMILGVADGFKSNLILRGVGYKASINSHFLVLNLGYSHDITVELPSYIKANVIKNTTIELESYDKEKLGQFVAVLKRQRKYDPYKGKGISKSNDYLRRKEGKKGQKND